MRSGRTSGFTLIEMMVTLSVVAVIAALAAPSFGDSFKRSRIKAHAGEIVSTLELAKTESVKRNQVTTTIAVANEGADWRVTTEWLQPDNSVMARSVSQSSQVTMLSPSVPGATTLTTAATLTGSFRGVFSGYVSASNCQDGDQCLQLRAPGGKYLLRVGINPIGQVTACTVGESFGGYPAC